MKKEMMINVLQPEETRIAILEDGTLEELYVERVSNEGFVGNIYKGRIVNIEPSIQAAFVDFGVGRNGFLHISDVDPIYYEGDKSLEELYAPSEKSSKPGRRRGDKRRNDRGRRSRDEDDDRPVSEDDNGAAASSTETEDRPRRRKSADDDDSGRRRRGNRRRRGGRRRDETVVENDIPEELTVSSDSLPDLDDFQLEDDGFGLGVDEEDSKEAPKSESPKKRSKPNRAKAERKPEPAPKAEPEPVEEDDDDSFGANIDLDLDSDEIVGEIEPEETPVAETEPEPEPEEESVPAPSASQNEEDEDGFGAGLFDEEDDEPKVEDQKGFFRRTDPSDDDDDEDGFGSGVFDEDEDDDPKSESSDEEEGKDRPRRRRRRGRRRRKREPENTETEEKSDDVGTAVEEPSPIADEEDDVDTSDFDDDDDDSDSEDSDRRGRGRGRRPMRGRNGHRGGSSRRPRQRPPIQEVFKRGQEVLVQVIKEGIGNKGPTLSTYISIPGRYLVLMPGLNRVGVSRKIVDEDARKRLRDIVQDIDRPDNVGFIIRTAGLDRTAKDLERDLNYLVRLWDVVVSRIRDQRTPAVIYQESDMIIRTIRDIFSSTIDTIYVDEPQAYERAKEFMQVVSPKYVDRLKLYDKPIPLFHNHKLEEEIERIQKRTVPLPKGGSIVIDQTEALVAIDVNSGNFRADDNAEETAYQINLAAAKEIARQLRLRDLGGVIVNDFIDMREERHRRGVENALREAVKRDRARTKVLRMSAFGLIEMTRQRIRPSLKRSFYRECPVCAGTGLCKTVESMCIECMRLLTFIAQRRDVSKIDLIVDHELAGFLQNNKRKELAMIETESDITISIIAKDMRSPEDFDVCCYNESGEQVSVEFGVKPNRR